MKSVLALLVLVYLAGVGFELAPTISTARNSPVSVIFASVLRELPDSLRWPAKAYHRFVQP
jgi:hypothetical protein